jgi:hypothetical protein
MVEPFIKGIKEDIILDPKNLHQGTHFLAIGCGFFGCSLIALSTIFYSLKFNLKVLLISTKR